MATPEENNVVDFGKGAAGGESIAKILKSKGPVVKCVVLRHMLPDGKDVKPHPSIDMHEVEEVASQIKVSDGAEKTHDEESSRASSKPKSPRPHHREILTELIDEIQLDTTPKENGAKKVLGGDVTFLGQYPEEGTILMVRADQIEDLATIEDFSIKELVKLCQTSPDIVYDEKTMLEKADLVDAVRNAQLPVNPHNLQPPFHKSLVRGDILILRVAHMEDNEEENDEADESISKAAEKFFEMSNISNEEFFLDYTKEEYIKFAERIDIVPPKSPRSESDDGDDEDEEAEEEDSENAEGNGDDEEDDDEPWMGEVADEEEDKHALLNLILGEVLKKFRADNKRGPNSEELLQLRSEIAGKLGLKLDGSTLKRLAERDQKPLSPSPKKVKFTPEVATAEIEDESDEQDDEKPAAKKSTSGGDIYDDDDDDDDEAKSEPE
jgi:hypothetical protein